MIASAIALAAAIAVAGGLFARRALLLTRLVRMGRPSGIDRTDAVPERLRTEAVVVVGQRKLLQRLIPGLMHAFIFWAFIVLFPAIFIAMIEIVDPDAAPDWPWYDALSDVFCVLALIGVATAFYIRKVVRPRRFEGSHLGEADLILLWIASIVGTLLALHATDSRVFAWAHVLLILGFLAYLPHSKHLHIATAAINVYFGRTRARGRLEPLKFDEDTPEEDMRFGIGTVEDLTWKQMMDAFSCTECGRCQDACPAYATGKVLSPKLVIMGVRDHLFEEGPKALAGDYEGPLVAGTAQLEEMAWDCVTCGACVEACPVNIEHIDHIVDLRRHLVMVESRFPSEAETMLRDVERQSNPWGKPQAERAAWAEGLDVRVLEPGDPVPEYLYWVGCAASYDERARESARSTAKLLGAAGVDFAILGPLEACTGDPARRMGNEFVYQAYAEQNVATLNEAGVTKIVASCPHCFNTLAQRVSRFWWRLRGRAPQRAAGVARARGADRTGRGRADDHLPRLLLPGPPQRRDGVAARARRRGRQADRDGAAREAHVLLRRRRRAHVDGGARAPDQRGARARGGRDRRRDAGRRLPVLHGDARRRRAQQRARHARCRRRHAARRVGRRSALTALDRPGDIHAGAGTELGEDVAEVGLDRLLAEEQLVGDLLVGLALGDQDRHLTLAP